MKSFKILHADYKSNASANNSSTDQTDQISASKKTEQQHSWCRVSRRINKSNTDMNTSPGHNRLSVLHIEDDGDHQSVTIDETSDNVGNHESRTEDLPKTCIATKLVWPLPVKVQR